MPTRKNFKGRRELRQVEAQARQEARDSRTDEEQLELLAQRGAKATNREVIRLIGAEGSEDGIDPSLVRWPDDFL